MIYNDLYNLYTQVSYNDFYPTFEAILSPGTRNPPRPHRWWALAAADQCGPPRCNPPNKSMAQSPPSRASRPRRFRLGRAVSLVLGKRAQRILGLEVDGNRKRWEQMVKAAVQGESPCLQKKGGKKGRLEISISSELPLSQVFLPLEPTIGAT